VVGARRLADGAGTATDAYSLDAFGRYMGGWGSTQNPYRFGAAWGYLTDTPGSGLLQLGARFYWAEIGRFIQQDRLHVPNRYVYGLDSPLRWIDPSGSRSATIEFYLPIFFGFGPGGSLTIGRNPCGGGWFGAFHVGAGIGGGVSYSPRGSSPGWDPRGPRPSCPDIGGWAGVSGSGGIGLGPLSLSLSPGAGGGWMPGKGWFGYRGWNPDVGLSPSLKLGATLNLGVDVGVVHVPTAF